ncbi:MAG: glycosyltransferase family 4 protein [Candidatus Methanomethylicia archaeon]
MVSPRVSGIGGVAQHVSGLINKLRLRGFVVDVVSVENTFHLPVKGLYNASFAFSSFWKGLFRRVKGVRYDVVHGHNLPSWFCVKSSGGVVKVLTQHGVYSEQIKFLYGGFLGFFGGRFESYALRGVDVLTCVSKSTYHYYRGIGVNAIYIPNAIDVEELPHEGVRLYDKQVVFVGRLSLEKGIDVLLSSLEYLDRDIHVLIIGSGTKDMEKYVYSYCRRFSNLHFLGYKPRDECLRYVKGSDLLVLPSRFEGLPTVLLEAMALKVPIIASRIPGVIDVINDSCAILIEPGNPKLLAGAIHRCFENYPSEFILKAYDKVQSEFNWKVVLEKYIKLYEDLLVKKRGY